MFFEEFTIGAWSYLVPFLVMVGVLYAVGTEYIETHMITFFPEVGTGAITEKEAARIRLVWPEKEVFKKAA
jgi:hypothetical protein